MVLHIKEGVRGVATPNGRTVGEIMDDIGNEGTAQEQELLDIIEYITERLIHSETERF